MNLTHARYLRSRLDPHAQLCAYWLCPHERAVRRRKEKKRQRPSHPPRPVSIRAVPPVQTYLPVYSTPLPDREEPEWDNHALWLAVWDLGSNIHTLYGNSRIPCRECLGTATYVRGSPSYCPGFGCHDCGWFKPIGYFGGGHKPMTLPTLHCVQCSNVLSRKTTRIRVYNMRHGTAGTGGGPYCGRQCFAAHRRSRSKRVGVASPNAM